MRTNFIVDINLFAIINIFEPAIYRFMFFSSIRFVKSYKRRVSNSVKLRQGTYRATTKVMLVSIRTIKRGGIICLVALRTAHGFIFSCNLQLILPRRCFWANAIRLSLIFTLDGSIRDSLLDTRALHCANWGHTFTEVIADLSFFKILYLFGHFRIKFLVVKIFLIRTYFFRLNLTFCLE